MVETPLHIDPKTLELLTSSTFDINTLSRGRPTTAAWKDAGTLIPQVKQFVQQHGNPPLHRVDLDQLAFNLYSHQPSIGRQETILMLQDGDKMHLVHGTLNPNPKQSFADLIVWIANSPLRQVSFPFQKREIQLMVSQQEAEETLRARAKLLLLAEAESRIPLPSLDPKAYHLHFRTDAWKNSAGNPVWLALPNTASPQESTRSFATNRGIVRCLDAMFKIGQKHFANYPSPHPDLR